MTDDEGLKCDDPVVAFVNDDKEDLTLIASRVNSLVSTLLSERKKGGVTAPAAASSEQTSVRKLPDLGKVPDSGALAMLEEEQDPTVQLAVVSELVGRCSAASAGRETTLSAVCSRQASIRALVDLLCAENEQLPVASLKLLFAAADYDVDVLRRFGVVRSLVDALSFVGDAAKAITMVIVQRISRDPRNRTAVARAGGIKALLAISQDKAPALCSTALKALTALTSGDAKLQEAVVRGGGGDVAIQLALARRAPASQDPRVQAAAISLLSNLVNCASFKARVSKETIALALGLLDKNLVYPETKFIFETPGSKADPARDHAVAVQSALLEILTKLAVLDSHREAMASTCVALLLNYITPGSSMAYDVFPWNKLIEERVLALLLVLLKDQRGRGVFTKGGGLTLLLNIISIPEVISEAAEVTCATIITGPLLKEMRSCKDLDQHLLRLFKFTPNNTNLQEILVETFQRMTSDEASSQRVFEEGGVHVLFKLLASGNPTVKLGAVSTLAGLSKYKFIRKVMRLLDPQLTQIAACAIPLIPDERSHLPISVLLCSLGTTEGAREFFASTQALSNSLAMLGPLCASPNVESRQLASKALLEETNTEATLSLACSGGALQQILKAMSSADAQLQIDAMSLAAKLCPVAGAHDALESIGFVAFLKAAGKTPNVLKKNPKLLDALSGLIAAYKAAPGSATPRAFEVVLDAGDGNSIKFPLVPDTAQLPFIEERAGNLLNATKRDQIVVAKASEIIKSTEDLRRALTGEKHAGNKCVTLRVSIRKLARTSSTANFHKVEDPVAELSKLGVEDLRKLVVLVCQKAKISVRDAVAALRAPPSPQPAPAATEKSPRIPRITGDQQDVFGSLLAELRSSVSSGRALTNHIDMAAEQDRRAKLFKANVRHGILQEIVQHKAEHVVTRRIISQEVVPGKELWRKGVQRWVDEIGDGLLGPQTNGALLRLVVHLASTSSATVAWADAMKLLTRPIPAAIVARILGRIGFSIKLGQFAVEGEETLFTEFLSTIRPSALPQKKLLRALEWKIAEAL